MPLAGRLTAPPAASSPPPMGFIVLGQELAIQGLGSFLDRCAIHLQGVSPHRNSFREYRAY